MTHPLAISYTAAWRGHLETEEFDETASCFQCAICLKRKRIEFRHNWRSGRRGRQQLDEPPVCHCCQFRNTRAQVTVGPYRDRQIIMNISALAEKMHALASKKKDRTDHGY